MRFWQLMANYNAESTTYSESAGTPASPYSPPVNGRLRGVRLIANRATAASLINGVQIKLTCISFKPNSIEVGIVGSGLQTAPIGTVEHLDWDVDQPVQTDNKITVEGRNISETDTPVTVSILIFGLFEVN